MAQSAYEAAAPVVGADQQYVGSTHDELPTVVRFGSLGALRGPYGFQLGTGVRTQAPEVEVCIAPDPVESDAR